MRNITKSLFTLIILSLVITGCEVSVESPLTTTSSDGALAQTGDIVVTSTLSDAALLLDKDGNFKKVLFNVPNNLDTVFGLTWDSRTNEILLAINGAPDRIIAISAVDGSQREAVRSTTLNGTVTDVAIAANGDYLVLETNNIERFTPTGSRVNDGDYPSVNFMTAPRQITSLRSGDYVACSITTDRVRIYNDAGVQQFETVSGIGGTTNAYGCVELHNGNIAVSWDGTTDSVVIYDSTLTTEIARFNDPSLLSAARGLGVKANGNILVSDAGFDQVIELDSNANFIRVLNDAFLNDPYQTLEIPDF